MHDMGSMCLLCYIPCAIRTSLYKNKIFWMMSYWPYHQGYFIFPQTPIGQIQYQNMRSPVSENGLDCDGITDASATDYTYYVKFINPKKKSDFLVRLWHNQHTLFSSPAELKIKLLDAFSNEVPATGNFQVSYFEPPSSTNRWIIDSRDLTAMYSSFSPGAKITLWCDRHK